MTSQFNPSQGSDFLSFQPIVIRQLKKTSLTLEDLQHNVSLERTISKLDLLGVLHKLEVSGRIQRKNGVYYLVK